MSRYALIRDGIVDNVCEWDGDTATWTPPEGVEAVLASDPCGPGWTYDGATFSPPPPPPAKTQFTYHEFLTELHTLAEQARFEVAVRRAEQTPAVDLLDPENALNLAVLQFHRRASVAPWIDRTLPVTATGLQVLKAAGVYGLDPEAADARIAQVLAGEPVL